MEFQAPDNSSWLLLTFGGVNQRVENTFLFLWFSLSVTLHFRWIDGYNLFKKCLFILLERHIHREKEKHRESVVK